MLMGLWRDKPGRRVGRAVLFSVLFAGLVELAQLFILRRYADVTGLLISGVLAGWVGAAAARWMRAHLRSHVLPLLAPVRSRVAAAIGLALVYSLPLAALYWTPDRSVRLAPDEQTGLAGLLVWPFARYYPGSEAQAMTNITYVLALFLPIGAVARWGCGANPQYRSAPWWFAGLLAAGIALVIEVGQSYVPGRVADSTDVILACCGGFVGCAVAGIVIRGLDRLRPQTGVLWQQPVTAPTGPGSA
jgi:VanZ family protein